MAEAKIYFNDLSETVQEQLWQTVKQQLLDFGEVAGKGKCESREEFGRRLEEEADYYINTHNFANRFII